MKQAIEQLASTFRSCTCPVARAAIGKTLNELSAKHFAATGEVLSCGQWVRPADQAVRS